VDEWLLSELRLAQRQGLLVGRHLSVAQYKATIILEFADQIDRKIEKAETDFRRFREAVVAAGHPKRDLLFPEFFPKKKEAEDVSEDYADVEWKSPSNAKEEYEALMAKVMANSHGSFGGNQFMNADDGWR
jgi:hypothetical protein